MMAQPQQVHYLSHVYANLYIGIMDNAIFLMQTPGNQSDIPERIWYSPLLWYEYLKANMLNRKRFQ